MKRAYGHIPDFLDKRDLKFGLSWFKRVVPESWVVPPGPINLFAQFPPVMDQGAVGLCTCCAVTAAMRYEMINNGLPDIPLSIAQLYYGAGELEGDVADVGRQIRDVIKVAAATGVAPDSMWPEDHWNIEPTNDILGEAAKIKAGEYRAIDMPVTTRNIRASLYAAAPVVIGVPVWKQFESDEAWQTGIIKMPGRFETPIASHSVILGGSDGPVLGFQNSWSDKWGIKGRGLLFNEYVEKYASDCWQITMNTETA